MVRIVAVRETAKVEETAAKKGERLSIKADDGKWYDATILSAKGTKVSLIWDDGSKESFDLDWVEYKPAKAKKDAAKPAAKEGPADKSPAKTHPTIKKFDAFDKKADDAETLDDLYAVRKEASDHFGSLRGAKGISSDVKEEGIKRRNSIYKKIEQKTSDIKMAEKKGRGSDEERNARSRSAAARRGK